jgi:hypothetical protein
VLEERKTEENLRTWFPSNRKPYANDYDYEDDSDLEEFGDKDEDSSDDELAFVPQVKAEKAGNGSDPVPAENLDPKINESVDITSASDLDSLFSESSDAMYETELASSAHVGKIVVIEDVAFVT